KRALPKLQVCFKANPRDVDTLGLLAEAFRELGQLPKTISVWKEVARIHQEAGNHDKRLEAYRRVLEVAPNDSDAKDALRGASRMSRRPGPPSGNIPAVKPPAAAMPALSTQAAPAPAPASAPAAADDDDVVVEEVAVE